MDKKLFKAVINGKIDEVVKLIEAGANINARDEN